MPMTAELNRRAAPECEQPAAGRVCTRGSRTCGSLTWEEERREVFQGVLSALRAGEPDADCVAACARLLGHLAQTEPRA